MGHPPMYSFVARIPEYVFIALFVAAMTPVTNYFRRRGRRSFILYCTFWVLVFLALVAVWRWSLWPRIETDLLPRISRLDIPHYPGNPNEFAG
jgi:hypothetical protein